MKISLMFLMIALSVPASISFAVENLSQDCPLIHNGGDPKPQENVPSDSKAKAQSVSPETPPKRE